jgi:hypothetical protein
MRVRRVSIGLCIWHLKGIRTGLKEIETGFICTISSNLIKLEKSPDEVRKNFLNVCQNGCFTELNGNSI